MAKIYIATNDGEVMDTIHVDAKTGWGDDILQNVDRILDAVDQAVRKEHRGH